MELVPEGEPVFFNEDLEPKVGSVVGVHDKLGQRAELGGPVPAVGAMNKHVLLAADHGVNDLNRCFQDE